MGPRKILSTLHHNRRYSLWCQWGFVDRGTLGRLNRNTYSTACSVFLRTYVLCSHFYFFIVLYVFSFFFVSFQCNNSVQRFNSIWQWLSDLHAVTCSVLYFSSCTICTFSLFCTPQFAHSVHLVTEEGSRLYSHHCPRVPPASSSESCSWWVFYLRCSEDGLQGLHLE